MHRHRRITVTAAPPDNRLPDCLPTQLPSYPSLPRPTLPYLPVTYQEGAKLIAASSQIDEAEAHLPISPGTIVLALPLALTRALSLTLALVLALALAQALALALAPTPALALALTLALSLTLALALTLTHSPNRSPSPNPKAKANRCAELQPSPPRVPAARSGGARDRAGQNGDVTPLLIPPGEGAGVLEPQVLRAVRLLRLDEQRERQQRR